jgi:Dyp-type peroxidase family
MDRLEPDDIQGLVLRGYRDLQGASFLLLSLGDPAAARRWVGGLLDRVTPGVENPREAALNLAFAARGLRGLGLPEAALDLFSPEFLTGMTTPHRSRILGDEGPSAPESWDWGGPSNEPIDVAVLVYARDDAALAPRVEAVLSGATASGLRLVRRLDTSNLYGKEHFGFRDGISQPLIAGLKAGPARDQIQPGEFLLGYPNEYGLYTSRPTLEPSADPRGRLAPCTDQPARKDLGRNGSYLVFRQLEQDVRGFREFVARQTLTTDGQGRPTEALAFAARMLGRWQGGAPLVRAPQADDPTLADFNDFAYQHEDPDGLKCPFGSHVRRANPRDSLDPDPGSDASVAIGKRHRIIRRGREYGRPLPEDGGPADADHEGRGIHFLCLNGNIGRQFEFLQSTWVNNPVFKGLYNDDDPLIGSRVPDYGGDFTIPAEPYRQRVVGLPRFVSVRGGAYFFLPGLRALRYLGDLS